MKRYLLSILVLVMAVLLAGCDIVPAAESSEAVSASAEPAELAAEMVYGRIKEINGNEILLVVGTMGQTAERQRVPITATATDTEQPRDERMPIGEGERPAFSGERMPVGEGERPAFSGERMPVGEGERPAFSGERIVGDGERPAFSGERMPMGEGERVTVGQGNAAMGQGIVLTGEEKIYQIPVTAKITAMQGSTELRFTQLAVKNTVCIYLDSDGDIFHVQLLQ